MIKKENRRKFNIDGKITGKGVKRNNDVGKRKIMENQRKKLNGDEIKN